MAVRADATGWTSASDWVWSEAARASAAALGLTPAAPPEPSTREVVVVPVVLSVTVTYFARPRSTSFCSRKEISAS